MILHQPPFLFVGDVKKDDPLEVWTSFPPDNPYVGSRPILIEAMAQAVGVFAGRQAGRARAGVLAMLKKIVFHKRATGRVHVRVTPGRMFGKLRVFRAEAFDGEALIAEGDLVVAESA